MQYFKNSQVETNAWTTYVYGRKYKYTYIADIGRGESLCKFRGTETLAIVPTRYLRPSAPQFTRGATLCLKKDGKYGSAGDKFMFKHYTGGGRRMCVVIKLDSSGLMFSSPAIIAASRLFAIA